MLFYIALQERMSEHEASRPFDPSHPHGKLDMSRGWSQCSPEMRQWWIDAAAEVIQKFTSGAL